MYGEVVRVPLLMRLLMSHAHSSHLQAHFMRHAGERARVYAPIDADGTELRQTSLAGAVADLYCAAAADGPFKGCPTSSFSDTVLRLRRVQRRTHAADEHEITDAVLQYRVTLHTPGGHLHHSPRGMPQTTYCLGSAQNESAVAPMKR